MGGPTDRRKTNQHVLVNGALPYRKSDFCG